ncbi:MAG: calcium-binding protein [Synechococcales cyanobacterium CRU_2_2]|nr:calcium-binding protein [Synechococcales cyanobacterium CRU_2_2]
MSAGVEQLAEDGAPTGVIAEFAAAGQGTVQGALLGTLGGPFAPNDLVRTTVDIDPRATTSQYFSYAAMILPSNDQFIANADPRDERIFSPNGRFLGAEFVIDASEAWDAGSEVNDERPANTAFFGQATPNTGVDENGVVTQALGFNPRGSGGILDSPQFSNADYLAPGYQFVRVRIANLIEGEAGNDRLFGTDAPDDIFAGNGNNVIFGNGGNDRIYSGSGNDRIFAGAGNDVIEAGDGHNTIYGNGGNDRILTGSGNDRIFAGLGNDVIITGAGNDLIFANGGNDWIDAGTGNDRVYAGGGSDRFVLNAGEGQVRIYNYGSNDRFGLGAGLSSSDTISARIQGNNTLISNGSDLLAILQGVQTTSLSFV